MYAKDRYNWFGNLDDLMCLDDQEAIDTLIIGNPRRLLTFP